MILTRITNVSAPALMFGIGNGEVWGVKTGPVKYIWHLRKFFCCLTVLPSGCAPTPFVIFFLYLFDSWVFFIAAVELAVIHDAAMKDGRHQVLRECPPDDQRRHENLYRANVTNLTRRTVLLNEIRWNRVRTPLTTAATSDGASVLFLKYSLGGHPKCSQ